MKYINEKLLLAFPTLNDEKDWLRYIDEFYESDPKTTPLNFKIGDDYRNWLNIKKNESKGVNLKEGRVPSTVYFLKEENDDRILGHISIRHSINTEFLSNVGGHIGYGVRPSERGKGYATIGLKLALKECEKLGIKNILITCKSNNIASAKCIEHNGGKLINKIQFDGEKFNRYNISLEKETKMKVDTNLFNELKERGLLYQCTDEQELKTLLESGKPISLYEGTDPTMDSLHIGHCVPYCILRRFQKAGHKVYLLMGGATACVGDPSGKSEMRQLLSKEDIDKNIAKIKETLSVFLDFDGENPAVIVNNADWFKGYDYIDFMREIGVHFNVNKMLSSEIYDNRLKEGGLTFFEMGYMLMQAYDFVHLNEKYGCSLEWGGADQWGNIVAGTELGRKLSFIDNKNRVMVGATNPLLLTPEGKKMGKTEKGAIWIDKDKISAYDFYQGVYQTPDACVEMMFALFTDVPMDKVKALIKEDIIKAKKELCFEITKFVRGEEDAIKAQQMSENLFTHGGDDAPEFEVSKESVDNGINICDLLYMTKLASSKSEARRLIEGNAITMKGEKVTTFTKIVRAEDFENNSLLLKKGKKSFIKVVIK